MMLQNHIYWYKNIYRNIVVIKIIVCILCGWCVPDAVATAVNKSKHIPVFAEHTYCCSS